MPQAESLPKTLIKPAAKEPLRLQQKQLKFTVPAEFDGCLEI